jgi:hypothetical protein
MRQSTRGLGRKFRAGHRRAHSSRRKTGRVMLFSTRDEVQTLYAEVGASIVQGCLLWLR